MGDHLGPGTHVILIPGYATLGKSNRSTPQHPYYMGG